jgi:hypothetical protein
MKHLYLSFILGISLLITGCSVFKHSGDSSKLEEKNRAKIVNVDGQIKNNTSQKLDTIAQLAYGTDYALSKVNEPPREVTVARNMNQRIVSLTGSPTIEKIKEMQQMIDKLTAQLAIERDRGEKALNEKDEQINLLQSQAKNLDVLKDSEIRKYIQAAQEMAANADAYKAELNKMDQFMGLGAVWYGVKKFVVNSMWILGIGGVLFIILRIASFSNPLAASIFSIFSTIGSWFIKAIEFAIPKAVQTAGHVAENVFNVYKSTLSKIVDGIQLVKDRSLTTGEKPNIEDVLNEVAKSMNTEEKEIVDEIKKALHWK